MKEVPRIEKKKMDIPPKWVIKEYLAMEPPLRFKSADLEGQFEDRNTKNQFLNQAAGFDLVVRLKRGEYFAVSTEIPLKIWALDDYYSRLLKLHHTFEYLAIDHAFYSFSATTYSDFSPDRVIPVLREEHEHVDQKHIDHFVYEFSQSVREELTLFDSSFSISSLSKEDTAVLLLSTYMPREMEAGKAILDRIDIDEETRAILGGLGYDEYCEGEYEMVDIKRPRYIQEWINEVGIEKVKERAGR